MYCADNGCSAIDADRQAEGKRPLKRKDKDEGSDPIKEIKVSRTDPEAGYMVRDDKPKGLFYLDHRTVDAKYSHHHRYVRLRGLKKNDKAMPVSRHGQNIKKIALLLAQLLASFYALRTCLQSPE